MGFSYAAELMKVSPPSASDLSQVARFRHIGLIPGETLHTNQLSQEIRAAMAGAPAKGHKEIRKQYGLLGGDVDKFNGWSMWVRPWVVGSYGIEYTQRAMIAWTGLGANQMEDAIYPELTVDSNGQRLKGGSSNKYVIHFTRDEIPPAQGPWSSTSRPTLLVRTKRRIGCPLQQQIRTSP